MPDAQILVVDDEPDVLSVLVLNLSRGGYRVTPVVNGQSALTTAEADQPDLVVLDVKLPDMDGYEVLRRLRRGERTRAIPVILITGQWEDEGRARGFRADDYITKPFSVRELTSRVETIVRRTKATRMSTTRRMSVGSVKLDREANRAFAGEKEIELTPLEYRLLEVLMERRGAVQTQRQLLHAVWETDAAIETRTVDMHVARLRTKLGPSGRLIETIRGLGYRFEEDDV